MFQYLYCKMPDILDQIMTHLPLVVLRLFQDDQKSEAGRTGNE
jgi:hypothetical protein